MMKTMGKEMLKKMGFFLKYLAIKICICYNADRQKDVSSSFKQGTNPPTVREYSWGILLFFYSGKAPTRLFVVRVITVKPFDNEVANHTARDSNEKGHEHFHLNTSSRCRVSVGQRGKYITFYRKKKPWGNLK